MSTEDIILYNTEETIKVAPATETVETFDLVAPDHPSLYKVLPESIQIVLHPLWLKLVRSIMVLVFQPINVVLNTVYLLWAQVKNMWHISIQKLFHQKVKHTWKKVAFLSLS